MSNLNNSSFFNSSARSKDHLHLDKLLSAFSNQDPDQSYCEMQQVLEEMQKDKLSKQKEYIEEIELLLTPHKCPKIAQVDKELEGTILQINDLQICDQNTYQTSTQKIKSVKRVITQIVDKYFSNLKNQYNFIANELVQIHLAPIKKLIYSLRKDLANYDETQYPLVVERQNQIKEELINLKLQLPKDIDLQITNQSLYDIKNSLHKLISITFKGNIYQYNIDSFGIIPSNFNGFKPQKKHQVQLKSKKGQIKLQEQLDTIYSYRDNTLYHSHVDYLDTVKQSKLILNNDPNQKLKMCNLVNTAQSLYFLGCLYQDSITNQMKFTNKIIKLNKHDNAFLNMTDIPILTYAGQSIKVGESIYYWGGYQIVNDTQLNNKKGFRYKIQENQWEQIESMKYPRIHGQCCISDSRIYLTGGMMNQFQGNALIEVYDTVLKLFNEPIELINQLSYTPQMMGYVFPISNQEILIVGGYNQFGNDENAQLINLFLKTVQRNQNRLPCIQNFSCTQPIICHQQIHLFNSEINKVELLEISADTLTVKKIIPLQ